MKKSWFNNITNFGFICFVILGILLISNFNTVLNTNKFNENLFYPIIVVTFLGIINLKIETKNNG